MHLSLVAIWLGVSPYRLSPAMGKAHPRRPSSDMAEPAPETLTEVAEIVRQLIDRVVLEDVLRKRRT